ncbi:hypothetical protein TI03_05335, partial [Achromatium sp. WMS1]
IANITGGITTGLEPGTAILQIKAKSKDPFNLSLTLDNYAPVSIGEKQGTINATLRNLSGWGEEINLGFSANAEKKRYGSVAFSAPINFYDTRIHASFQRSTTALTQEPIDILDIEGDYKAYEFGITHPIIHNLERSVILGINIGHKSNYTTLLGEPFCLSSGCVIEDDGTHTGESSISTIGFSQRWTERSSKYVYSMRSIITVGGDFLGDNSG